MVFSNRVDRFAGKHETGGKHVTASVISETNELCQSMAYRQTWIKPLSEMLFVTDASEILN